MAINHDLPAGESTPLVTALPSSSSSSSSSASSSPLNRRRLSQVATSNSATFIPFPNTARQASSFVPVCRPRTSLSSLRLPLQTLETQSLSNQSKLSATALSSSNVSEEQKRGHSQHRINPILNNPLLNHRKEQPKSPLAKPSHTYSYTTRLCLSSRPLKPTSNEALTPATRARTAPVPAYSKATGSNNANGPFTPTNAKPSEQQQQQQQLEYVDASKHDYITRWLKEIRAATHSTEPVRGRSRRTKRQPTPSA